MLAADLLERICDFVDGGDVPGAIVGVYNSGRTSVEAASSRSIGNTEPLDVGTPVRISSNTKPLIAALTMTLADDGVLALDDRVERFVPELADREVLRRLDADPSDTVPATRPVTVEDLLTMRLGFGFAFEAPCAVVDSAAYASSYLHTDSG